MLRRWLTRAMAGVLLAGGGVGATGVGNTIRASDLEKGSSLRLAPKDADLYSSSMLMKEQWERLIESEFAKEILKSDWVQASIEKYKRDWEVGGDQVAQVKMALKTPIVQELLALGKEMISEEAFMIGDGRMSKFYLGVNSLQKEVQSIINSEGPEGALEWIETLKKEDIDEIPVPTFIVGFKIEDSDRALNLIDQLQGIVSIGMASVPSLATVLDGFERVEDQRGTRLVLTLSSSMIPWEDIPGGSDEQEMVIEKMEEVLEGRQFAITFGLLDQYVVMGLSESGAKIAELGERGSLLENPQLKPLLDRKSEKITGISFVSDAMSDAQFEGGFNHYFSNLYTQLAPALEAQFGDDYPEFLEPLEDDLEWLDESIGKFVPEFKGSLGFTFLKGEGQEGFNYARTKAMLWDGSKKLEVLQHCGENPLMMVAVRHQYHPEWFHLSREIVQKAKPYLDGLRDSEFIDEGSVKELSMFLDQGWPILKRLADVWESKFLPATKDGQHAWVMTAGNLESKQWVKDMPPSKYPLPLPEFGTVSSLSDKDQLVSGFVELFSIFDSVVETAREVNPDAVPAGYSVPRPEKASDGSYKYPIPDDCPVPKEMAPQVSIENDWMVATYSDKQTKALSSVKKLSVGSGLIDPTKPLAAAAYLDLGGIAKFATPWLQYGLDTAFADPDAVLNESAPDMPAMKVKDVMQLWSAFSKLGKVASSTEVQNDGSTVTHWSYTR